MIKPDYKSGIPLHEQITKGIKDLIMSGAFKKDEQLPSVREMSVSLTVNPNTVQRAYRTLESEGIIYSIRGKGNFVSDMPKKDPLRLEALYRALEETLTELRFLGEKDETAQGIFEKIFKEGNEEK